MAGTVGIVAGSISGNKGAEAMLSTVVGSLAKRLPDARFVIFSPYYKADKGKADRYPRTEVVDGGPVALVTKIFPLAVAQWLLGPLGVRPMSLTRATRRLADCDVIVDVAGISFVDGREKYLPFNVLTIWPPMLLGIDVVKASQACGPFAHRLNRWLARWLLPRCRRFYARGASTVENLAAVNIEPTDESPDVALALNDLCDVRQLDEPLAKHLAFGDAGRKLVGLSPSSVVYAKCLAGNIDYIGIHAEFVRRLVDSGHRVMVLPHSWRRGQALKNNDLPIARMLMDRLGPAEQVSLVAEELDSISLRKLTAACDLFFASRFHGMIGALATATPVMVCGWGHKYFEMLDMFGMRQFAFDSSDLSIDRLMETFGRLEENADTLRQHMAEVLPAVLDNARKQIDAVVDLLDSMQAK